MPCELIPPDERSRVFGPHIRYKFMPVRFVNINNNMIIAVAHSVMRKIMFVPMAKAGAQSHEEGNPKIWLEPAHDQAMHVVSFCPLLAGWITGLVHLGLGYPPMRSSILAYWQPMRTRHTSHILPLPVFFQGGGGGGGGGVHTYIHTSGRGN